jgi:hypothetical protein
MPCARTISQCGSPKESAPPQFPLSQTNPSNIAFTTFDGDWTVEPRRKRPKLGQVDDEIEGALLATDNSPNVRTVVRIRHEIISLKPGIQFKDSEGEMAVRLGVLQGRIETTLGPSLTPKEIKLRANSTFLLECIQEAQSKE